MKVLVFDNYDSFTYNLVHLVEKITGITPDVYRNDALPLEKIAEYDKIILSPGPGLPAEAGLLLPLLKTYAATKSILGVCLGHQAIGEAFGATLINLTTVYHGVATPVTILKEAQGSGYQNTSNKPRLFDKLPETISVGRYHSWVIGEENFPDELEITARDDHGYIMALQHRKYDVQGVQFHPESVLTPQGETILRNWLNQ
ncbi:MAG TPA: aminodeoxychorismate/anthranilate synthase component II [Chitinophagaceae bacterium]|nr:aminodeoxychorismate/anthranilate synthase component II [Chitinophagaceae bacterium]